jgi:L-amino acid N-acyltransferase YncA
MLALATDADVPAILTIYNEVVATSTAIYRDDPAGFAERAGWLAERRAGGFPVLVARDDDGRVTAFGSYGAFRTLPGYATTVEHTVMVAREHRGRGLGSRLVAALIEHATGAGAHAMVASIDGENLGSIRMHERLGFVEVGRLPEVGRKFDRWLDLVLLQRRLA